MGKKQEALLRAQAEAAQKAEAKRLKQEEYLRREALYREIAGIKEGEPTNKKPEIEQKYRIHQTPDVLSGILAARGTLIEIRQGYTVDGVRLREEIFLDGRKPRYTVSYKRKKDDTNIEREEPETEIGRETFDQYWSLTEDRVVEKLRTEVVNFIDSYTLHYDVYTSPHLQGIVVAEIEFSTRQIANQFANPPTVLGTSVETITGRQDFTNKAMSIARPQESSKSRR